MTVDNPKASMGRQKVSFSCVPEISQLYLAAAHNLGAVKYGKMNWREIPIKASDYLDAIRRHLTQWASGEDIDPESGLPHLACAMAGISIVLDANAHGTLKDDREKNLGLPDELRRLAELKKSWVAEFGQAV